MPKPPIGLPPESNLPRGPQRDLLTVIHELYSLAATPALTSVARLSREAPEEVDPISRDTASRLLHGKHEALARLRDVESLAFVLQRRARPEVDPWLEVSRVRKLWESYNDAARRSIGAFSPRISPGAQGRSLDYATHHARRTLVREFSHQAHPVREPHLQGSLAVVPVTFDSTTTGRRVFDREFQERDVAQAQQWGMLRPDGHQFKRENAWCASSYTVRGHLLDNDHPVGYISVEVRDNGVVSVYFREEVGGDSLPEALDWWVQGAAHTCFHVLQRLGALGEAHLSILLDRRGLLGPGSESRAEWKVKDPGQPLTTLNWPSSMTRFLFAHLDGINLWDISDGDPQNWAYRAAEEATDRISAEWRASPSEKADETGVAAAETLAWQDAARDRRAGRYRG